MTYAEKLLKLEKRNRTILKLREKGWTYKKLTEKYGISRQRIFAIISQERELLKVK
jgi:Mor family transcriptional regulator